MPLTQSPNGWLQPNSNSETRMSNVEQGISNDEVDSLVKSQKMASPVIPAKAGIQVKQALLDPGFRRGDDFDDFLRKHQY